MPLLVALLFPVTLLTDWEYCWIKNDDTTSSCVASPITFPAHPERASGSVLLLRTRVPSESVADPVVAFDAILGPFEASLDGQVFYRFPQAGLETRFPPGVPWQVLPLPSDAAGKTLQLRIRTDGLSTPIRGTPRFGSRAEVLTAAIERDVPRLGIALLIIFLGVLGVAFAASAEPRLLAGYLLSTVPLGLYVVVYTHLKDLLVPLPQLWFVVWLVAVPAQLVGSLLFLRSLFAEVRLFAVILRVQLGYVAALVCLHALAFTLYVSGTFRELGVLIFGIATTGLRVLIGVSVMVVCAVLARRRDKEARIFLVGLLVLCAAVMLDLLAAFGVASLSWKSQVHFGALAMAVAFSVILARRYALAQALAISAATERERMLRDLHDGVGGLTTNVRMLAELGRSNSSRAESALASIVELSDAALAELRSLVRTLDDRDVTWDGLASELRQQGAQLVEGTGARFTMEAHVACASVPNGLLVLTLLRVFREAITNACKQLGLKEVRVSFRVSTTGLRLLVENDGAGAQRPGVSAGRGVSNMRARAAEVGGSLRLNIGPQTSLCFEAPVRT